MKTLHKSKTERLLFPTARTPKPLGMHMDRWCIIMSILSFVCFVNVVGVATGVLTLVTVLRKDTELLKITKIFSVINFIFGLLLMVAGIVITIMILVEHTVAGIVLIVVVSFGSIITIGLHVAVSSYSYFIQDARVDACCYKKACTGMMANEPVQTITQDMPVETTPMKEETPMQEMPMNEMEDMPEEKPILSEEKTEEP